MCHFVNASTTNSINVNVYLKANLCRYCIKTSSKIKVGRIWRHFWQIFWHFKRVKQATQRLARRKPQQKNPHHCCHFEPLQKAKNPQNSKHFKFMDTSLSYESSVWQCKEFLDIFRYRPVWQSPTLFCLIQTSIFWYLNAKIHKVYAVLFNRRFVFMDTSLRSVWQNLRYFLLFKVSMTRENNQVWQAKSVWLKNY